jgi:hypothetical protein
MRKLLLLGLLVILFAPAVRAQSFDLSKDRVPIVSLDGLWRFHPGDNPGPGPARTSTTRSGR